MNELNPYTPPHSVVDKVNDIEPDMEIDNLTVSDKWKERFRAIKLAGGPKLPNFKTLPKEQRRKAMSFNILAFLFGPFYYVAKGMWKKGLALFLMLFLIAILLGLGLEYIGYGKFAKSLGYGISAIFALRANLDYYKKMVLKNNGWF